MTIQGFAIMLAMPAAGLLVAWLFFRWRWRTARADDLADLAWQCAGELLNMPGGKRPPVRLRKKPKGTVIGNYASIPLPLIGPLFQRIWVVDNVAYIFRNTAHEMAHAKRRQAGKPNDGEVTAEKIEAAANAWAAKGHAAELAAALNKLKG